MKEGWIGKQKGALQILFERGWINPVLIYLYTVDSKKDKTLTSVQKVQPAVIILSTS